MISPSGKIARTAVVLCTLIPQLFPLILFGDMGSFF